MKTQTALGLVGLEAISKAVGCSEKTVKRLIQEDGLPARKDSDGKYRASEHAIIEWFSKKGGTPWHATQR